AVWAALRIESPERALSARRTEESRGSVSMVRRTATSLDSTPALAGPSHRRYPPRMESILSEVIEQRARESGLALTAAEAEALAPVVGRRGEMLEGLGPLRLAGVEPAVQYRIF